MDFIRHEATTSTPEVDFNPSTGYLSLRGESYPENSFEFFKPLRDWTRTFLAQDPPKAILEINMTYLNTSSTKCMMDLLDLLEEAYRRGVATRVVWRYHPQDERSVETAEEFREDYTLPFDLMPEVEAAK